jgi:predicted SAM-dependent methyltransferase
VAPVNWRNYDGSLNAKLGRFPWLARTLSTLALHQNGTNWPKNVGYLNLNKPWPFTAESVDVVYASHVFEHLTPSTGNLFLSEAKRVLRPDGVLRLVVPDLRQHARRYLEELSTRGGQATEYFITAINLRTPPESTIRAIYSHFVDHPHVHKMMYDDVTLPDLVRSFGFQEVIRRERAQSGWIPEVAEVERGPTNDRDDSLYIDARL